MLGKCAAGRHRTASPFASSTSRTPSTSIGRPSERPGGLDPLRWLSRSRVCLLWTRLRLLCPFQAACPAARPRSTASHCATARARRSRHTPQPRLGFPQYTMADRASSRWCRGVVVTAAIGLEKGVGRSSWRHRTLATRYYGEECNFRQQPIVQIGQAI